VCYWICLIVVWVYGEMVLEVVIVVWLDCCGCVCIGSECMVEVDVFVFGWGFIL